MAEKLNKVFGIISYFPNNDSEYHIETRRERSRRFRELLFKLEELWPDIDIMVIAQNWQDFELPEIKNKIIQYHYDKLGILGARRELRKRFLDSDYDYLIMLDDDFIIEANDPKSYMDEIDNHPNGFGALKRTPPSPLPFFAISKHIYSQIDMPDIDPEKGEGFEDDIFTSQCFAQFGDAAFIFPMGCVADKSFHYNGPGKCPSTWSKERKYDWNYMRTHTKSTIYQMTQSKKPKIENKLISPTIDLIITYVNSSDRLWVNEYVKATRTHNPTPTRFRSWGTLKYLFRGIDTYMPFVRNVILVVASPTQVPVWVNTKNVRIVYHKDFIPEEYLPTFNSCTIESFFWNIPDLSDRVIYFNDDIFPVNQMSETDFFTEGRPNIRFTEPTKYSEHNMFHSQCRSGIDLISKVLNLPSFESGKIFRPYHISSAFLRDDMHKVGELCKFMLPDTVSITRATKNVNQYIYQYYQYFTNGYVDCIVDYKYFELYDKTIQDISDELLYGEHKLLCLNDSDKLKDYARVRYLLQNAMARKFPDPCKYEL